MNLSVADFAAFHAAVHGNERRPFDWQTRLLRQVVDDRAWPDVLDLPTGAGKTTCIDIALFALALDAGRPSDERWCPRRIALVVDRRVVVDQAAERGRRLLRVLVDEGAPSIVRMVADRLRSLCGGDEEPLGVFTLRGGMPKDDGWARTPDQPLIIASTVDQLGSRLLIQGYGVSEGMKPVHAGLLANDVLLLLDEVHLSRPFAETLAALARLRAVTAKRRWLPSRFHHVFLSATPGASAGKAFRLREDEVLPRSSLGARLHASKRTRLYAASSRVELEKECVEQARDLAQRHDVVAVVLNRVASAATVARQLRETSGAQADVVLLTGRMRPLDRDDVMRSLRARIESGRDRPAVERKLVVVGTQCIEAGADFDFDAMVTEVASLDALRQRFGRVDRLGAYGRAEGVVVYDKSAKEDPVYGEASLKTAAWIKKKLAKKTKELDFGVLALPLPSADESAELLAPRPHAPVLLPAYLDLWMQTSPAPAAVPDVGLWLHGARSGPAEVQIVWRADLTEQSLEAAFYADGASSVRRHPVEVVAAVRPSSLEAVSVPFAAARRWLSGADAGDVADVEGAVADDGEARGAGRALRWAGDDSEVVDGEALRPGDTIVVPAVRGGIRDGCFDPTSTLRVQDLAERAVLLGKGVPVLRLQDAVLAQLGLSLPIDDADETRVALHALAERAEPGSWVKVWLEALSCAKARIVVDGDVPWTVILGKRVGAERLRAVLRPEDTTETGLELTTDGDDSFHAGQAVTLAAHSADVERFARGYATALGLPGEVIEDVALAAWLHDIGKADSRFQILLRGGSEIDLYKDETPWAKSLLLAGAKAAHRLARRRSKYPAGARHEVQSVAMLEKHLDAVKARARDLDLVLHLVASHHGHCRPFAPVVADDNPVEVTLRNHTSDVFGSIDVVSTSSQHEMHRLDAPLGDRFWRLVERYGWLELCWLEAVLRLADHRASEMEQASGGRS